MTPPNKPDAGYGKPPAAHQFKPGQSGNPTGRKHGSRNLKSDLEDELAETIIVQEGGVSAALTKQRALVKRLAAKALSGDGPAMAQIIQLTLRLLPPEMLPDGVEEALPDSDQAILDRYLARAAQTQFIKGDGDEA